MSAILRQVYKYKIVMDSKNCKGRTMNMPKRKVYVVVNNMWRGKGGGSVVSTR